MDPPHFSLLYEAPSMYSVGKFVEAEEPGLIYLELAGRDPKTGSLLPPPGFQNRYRVLKRREWMGREWLKNVFAMFLRNCLTFQTWKQRSVFLHYSK